jgi:hypothetical protein
VTARTGVVAAVAARIDASVTRSPVAASSARTKRCVPKLDRRTSAARSAPGAIAPGESEPLQPEARRLLRSAGGEAVIEGTVKVSRLQRLGNAPARPPTS